MEQFKIAIFCSDFLFIVNFVIIYLCYKNNHLFRFIFNVIFNNKLFYKIRYILLIFSHN